MSECVDLFGVDENFGVYIETLEQSKAFLERASKFGADIGWISEDDYLVFPIYVIESSENQDYYEAAAYSKLSDMFNESKYITFDEWRASLDSKESFKVSGLEELL